jgi:putative transposase
MDSLQTNTSACWKIITNTFDNVAVKRPLDKQNLCLDKGYDFLEVQRSSIKKRYILNIRHKEKDDIIKKNRKYLAKRWVVAERTNSWHNGFRKLLIRYEKKSTNYLA